MSEIRADTDRLRQDSFGPYREFTKSNHDTFVATCEANAEVLPGKRRSDVDDVVAQLPGTDRAATILEVIFRLPDADREELLAAADTFERIEEENRQVAGSTDPSGAGRH
ncbi:hypothetical protein J2S43_001199 [Catenuloplanes nepalensis]|uniref:Uncharacterized protein n=1 Tax=Catenuloplanes nepalensis TaxID=587533 RepID=A0ABT9MMP8_9ACTN|nr:hypothetical protein [Catenuloplanes nepalensis]MDP9792687.1 hypothetical protein [Catenuloplanes nepalensis]